MNVTSKQILSVTLYLLICLTHWASSLTFELPDNERSCFYESFQGVHEYVFQYNVLRGGNNDVDVTVTSPQRQVIVEDKRSTTGAYKFFSETGDFEFCFGNQFSAFTHKIVQFTVKPTDVARLAVEAGNMRPHVDTAMESSCNEIHKSLSGVVDHQRLYRVKESISRTSAEILNERVMVISAVGAALVVFTGLGQVILVKKLFSDKKRKSTKSDAKPKEVRHHTSILLEA